jgi:hypothetical protein
MGQYELDNLAIRLFDFEFDLITPTVKHTLGNDGEKRHNQAHCGGDHCFSDSVCDRPATTANTSGIG